MKELITKIDLADKLSLSIGTKAVRFNSEDVDKWLVEHYPKKYMTNTITSEQIEGLKSSVLGE